jgi:hypothetical protein
VPDVPSPATHHALASQGIHVMRKDGTTLYGGGANDGTVFVLKK